MQLLDLFEARRNPEMNPKEDICAELPKYAGSNNFVVYSDSEMLNIREFHGNGLPYGIYLHDIDHVLKYRKQLLSKGNKSRECIINMPGEQTNKKFILVVKFACNSMIDSSYSKSQLKKDVDKLIVYVMEKNVMKTDELRNIIGKHIDYVDEQDSILNIVYDLSRAINPENYALTENSIYRYLGYCGIRIDGTNPLSQKRESRALTNFSISLSTSNVVPLKVFLNGKVTKDFF